MAENRFILVSTSVLPPVFEGVLLAKQYLADGSATSATMAAKMAGISRNAFYKYRNAVYSYASPNEHRIELSVVLSDKAGVFSGMTAVLSQYGVNLITVNQNPPIDGAAAVSMLASTEGLCLPVSELLEILKRTDGVISVRVL